MCVQLNTVVIKLCFMRCGYLSLSKYELKSEVKLCGHLVCLNRYYKTNHKEKYKNLTFYKSTHSGMEQSRPALRFCKISPPQKSKQ